MRTKKLFLSIFAIIAILLSTGSAAVAGENESLLKQVNGALFSVLFFDVSFGQITDGEVDRSGKPVLNEDGTQREKVSKMPLVVVVLLLGAVFFTLWYNWINVRGFKHSIDVIRGHYDDPEDQGEISHFRALTSALSATVGLGNIAGVAVAIQIGGPGAVFWMMVMALFGMSAKFNSCTLALLYRKVNSDGSISGGPMYYLDIGLRKMGGAFVPLGKVLGIMYAFMVMGGAIGGGNMFQANQTVEAFRTGFGFSESANLVIGIIMAALVGVVILGGIKRIGYATSRIVPLMCTIYVLASVFVILSNISKLPEALLLILTMGFTNNAFFGGLIGVLMTGVQRAAFSNESGLGSAAIAHAAAKTDEPVREGMVAMIGPFIDTMIVCLMTSLVVIITGTWANPELASQGANIGVTLTSEAFRSVIPWFPVVLTICICLFAYSTMISWCYYGERGWIYVLDHFDHKGLQTVVIYRILFVVFVVIGAVNKLSDVIDFTDAMILSMALPNIVGSVLLAPKVKPLVKDYWNRLQSGEMKPYVK